MIKRLSTFLIAALAWLALTLEWAAFLSFPWAKTAPISKIILFYISYFTLISHILVACTMTVLFIRPKAHFPKMTAVLTTYMIIVATVFHLFLAHLYPRSGLHGQANFLLHTVVPAMVVLYWLFLEKKGQLNISHILCALPLPAIYLIFILLRGRVTHWYPYPFLNAGRLGYPAVFMNSTGLAIAFVLTGLLLFCIDRLCARYSSD